ncbi:hypothetical protein [Spirosoma fluminis]
MLTLKLHPNEFKSLMQFLRLMQDVHGPVPLMQRHLAGMVLIGYLERWKPHQILAWGQRRVDKAYRLNLPLTVARALYQEMQCSELIGWQQIVLNKLDQALINYQDPSRIDHLLL